MLTTKRKKMRIKRAIALFMLFTIANQILAPSIALALTAGPTAPEATNFEPIDTTDMVNPLTGSFTYGMPLLEVPGPEGGYPLALSYHAGIQPNEEASWVGLGWSLNPGAIARNVNGYPDDWNASTGAGGTTSNYWNGGTQQTYSVGISLGVTGTPASVNFGLSFSQDTYRGSGLGWDIGAGYGPFSLSIGVSAYGQWYKGAGLQYSAGGTVAGGLSATTTIGIQTNFSSISASLGEGLSASGTNGTSYSLTGASISTSSISPSLSVGGVSATSVNNSNAGSISSTSNGLTIPIPLYYGVSLSLGYEYTRYWSSTSSVFTANGVINNNWTINNGQAGLSNTSDDDNYSLPDPIYVGNTASQDPLRVMGGTFPNFDDYSVTAQGLGGNMRPYVFSSVLFNQNRLNSQNPINNAYSENFPSNVVPNSLGKKWQFRFINDVSNSYQQGHPWNSDLQFSFDGNPQYGYHDANGNNDGNYGYDPSTNRLEGTNHIEYFTNAQISTSGNTTSGQAALRGFITCPDAAGFLRSGCDPNQIGGFMITNASGVTYHYALPAYSSNETIHTETTGSQPGGFSSSDLNKNTPYAYTWYLTAITGPDYVSRGSTPGLIDKSDWGYWVKFDYGKWDSKYNWRTPSSGLNTDVENQFHIFSKGIKEVYYLDAIETRTHTAIFEKEIRADAKDAIGVTQITPGNLLGNCNPMIGYAQTSLRLNNIYLFQNDQLPVSIDAIRNTGTVYNQTLTVTRTGVGTGDNDHDSGCSVNVQPFNGQNVIDKFDITPALVANCLRKISFNYDYSLCPGVPKSVDPGGLLLYLNQADGYDLTTPYGKLTLLSVDFQGKSGTPMTPPILFQYDLDPTNPANQGNINIITAPSNTTGVVQGPTFVAANGNSLAPPLNQTSPINQYGTITVQIPGNFNAGDILSFALGGTNYYCTLLSTQDGGTTFKVLFLNNSPGSGSVNPNANIPAVKTKNPPYNYDAFDCWQCYKSDYIANPNNVNLARFTTPVSNMSTDVWSLRRIVSSVGANININYEGNTFNRSVLNKNPSIIVGNNNAPNTINSINSDGTIDMIAVNPQYIDLTQIFKIGAPLTGPLVFLRQSPVDGFWGYLLVNLASYPLTHIVSITNSTNDIKVQLDPQFLTDYNINNVKNVPIANLPYNSYPAIQLTTGNLISIGSSGLNYGGGIRVKNFIVDDLNGNVKQTSYNYGALGVPASPSNTSGVTSYLPNAFDADNLAGTINPSYLNSQVTADVNLESNYRNLLYKYGNYLLAVAREVPSPGVMYETVSVTDSSLLPNGNAVPINGTTVYQYEVFKPEMLGIMQYYYRGYLNLGGELIDGYPLREAFDKDVTIKDYTSRVGNLKRVITYDDKGNKLTEKINHYLYDDLDNTNFQNQVNNYEPRLSAYNNMGIIKERYATARVVTDSLMPPSQYMASLYWYDQFLVMSNKETFPSFQTGTTQIDYKNGTTTSQTNLAYDFYTGAVTKTLTTDSYGNRFIGVATPAYMAGYSNGGVNTLSYPALGLKTHDDDPGATQHKQMLTQQASNYTFSVDGSNNPIGVVTASVQTWSNSVPVIDQDGNAVNLTDPSTGQSNIWRMEKSFSWMAPSTAQNNITPITSFADYYAGGSNNASWKKTAQVTKYNVYSAALEATDINNSYAATRMGYNNSKVLFTGGVAMYNEIAYAGAEDALVQNGTMFSNQISPGSGVVVTDSTKAHTGVNSLMVPVNSNGFTYTVPISSLNPTAQSYSVAVWVKAPTSGTVNQASLYYTVNGATVTVPQAYSKSAAGYYLLEMTIPATALTGASGNLVVGCSNSGTANALYFDDFRFQPTAASATAYVYDNQTGELTYIIGNNNLYTRFQYDAIGRLVRTYKEVLGKPNIPMVKGVTYNYARGN